VGVGQYEYNNPAISDQQQPGCQVENRVQAVAAEAEQKDGHPA
jgi:hypothetical protein